MLLRLPFLVPGGEATVWDPTHPHGNPEHTDAEIWKRNHDGSIQRDRGSKVHIPTDLLVKQQVNN